MRRPTLAALAALVAAGAARVGPTRPMQEIPLAEVWALDMPGTRPMSRVRRGAPPAHEAPEGALVDEIVRALGQAPRAGGSGGACFAVPGTGMDALRAAHAVLVGGRAAATSFRAGDRVSVVFYSRSFDRYVHLADVRWRGRELRLAYRLVPHETREVTAHLALVPLTVPARGPVRAAPTPVDADERAAAWASRVVCAPFAFDVARD